MIENNHLTLEKMKIAERVTDMEKAVIGLDASVKEIKEVLFGERGEKGVVGKLKDIVDVANTIATTLSWIAKLVVGAVIIAALPAAASFINIILQK